MNASLTIERKVEFRATAHGEKQLHKREQAAPAASKGRVPRVARLSALAHRFEALVRTGAVRDYADLARAGHVTRARISQILSLLSLAPDIQEEILELRIAHGPDPIHMHHLLRIVRELDWAKQRSAWQQLKSRIPVGSLLIT